MLWWRAKPIVGGCKRNRLPCETPNAPMRSVRPTLGTPPTASKKRTSPSKVCSRSTESVNHHSRQRDQHKMHPKHHTSPSPHRSVQSLQSEKSN